MNRLVIFTNHDDWEGLFVEGVLVDQGHEIKIDDLDDHCPIASIKTEEMGQSVVDALHVFGQFPHGITLEEARVLKRPPEPEWGEDC